MGKVSVSSFGVTSSVELTPQVEAMFKRTLQQQYPLATNDQELVDAYLAELIGNARDQVAENAMAVLEQQTQNTLKPILDRHAQELKEAKDIAQQQYDAGVAAIQAEMNPS